MRADVKDVRCIFDRSGDIMGDHDDCHAFPVQVPDQFIHLRSHFRIQPGDRFIQQEDLPGGSEGPGKQDALLLSAGQLSVAAARQIRDPHPFHILFRQLFFGFVIKRAQSAAALTA